MTLIGRWPPFFKKDKKRKNKRKITNKNDKHEKWGQKTKIDKKGKKRHFYLDGDMLSTYYGDGMWHSRENNSCIRASDGWTEAPCIPTDLENRRKFNNSNKEKKAYKTL